MSIAKCKCDKIFDSDEQLNYDESGDCCCDSCFEDISVWLEEDLKKSFVKLGVTLPDIKGLDILGSVSEELLNKGYRKVK